MAYNPADLKLPHWLLRVLDGLVALRVLVAPRWQFGMTRPGALLVAVLVGLWLAAFYSGNNLLYLCGAMLTALMVISIWQAVRLLRSLPPLADSLPSNTEAGTALIVRKAMAGSSPFIGLVEIEWTGEGAGEWAGGGVSLPLQLRLEEPLLLSGRFKADRRGLYRLRRQRLTTTAPLGLWNIRYCRDESADWAVTPKGVPWVLPYLGGGQQRQPFEGDDLRDLRSYVPGDALSRIHWRKAAADSTRWSVKRFEQHEPEVEALKLRIDLRLADAANPNAFEQLLGQAWFWVDNQLQSGREKVSVVLGQQPFDLALPEDKKAFVRALAAAAPQQLPAAGDGGLLLSLVEKS